MSASLQVPERKAQGDADGVGEKVPGIGRARWLERLHELDESSMREGAEHHPAHRKAPDGGDEPTHSPDCQREHADMDNLVEPGYSSGSTGRRYFRQIEADVGGQCEDDDEQA